jgi:ketosteroid isomerase-like protein
MNLFLSRHLKTLLIIALICHVNFTFAHEKVMEQVGSDNFSGLDSESALATIEFHHALQNGDKEIVMSLLADDLIVFEGGIVERSLAEYAAHHLDADILFLKKLQIEHLEHHVDQNGDTAISMYRMHVKGEYKGETIDSEGMETLMLRKLAGKWKIVHIHWSN